MKPTTYFITAVHEHAPQAVHWAYTSFDEFKKALYQKVHGYWIESEAAWFGAYDEYKDIKDELNKAYQMIEEGETLEDMQTALALMRPHQADNEIQLYISTKIIRDLPCS